MESAEVSESGFLDSKIQNVNFIVFPGSGFWILKSKIVQIPDFGFWNIIVETENVYDSKTNQNYTILFIL